MSTHSTEHRDLVPLEAGFDKVWRGWRPDQVTDYLDRVEADVQTLVADRDAALANVEELMHRLDESRNEVGRLREELDRVSRAPIDTSALDPLLRRKVELAEHSAEHIVGRARLEADEKQRTADQLLTTYRSLLADAQRHRAEAETGRREMIRQARADAEAITTEADEDRRLADEQSQQRRARAEAEFAAALQRRRIDDDERHAQRLAHSKAQASRILLDAATESDRIVARATDQADAVRRTRTQVAERLDEVRALLAGSDQSWQVVEPPAQRSGTVEAPVPLRWPDRSPVDLTPPDRP